MNAFDYASEGFASAARMRARVTATRATKEQLVAPYGGKNAALIRELQGIAARGWAERPVNDVIADAIEQLSKDTTPVMPKPLTVMVAAIEREHANA